MCAEFFMILALCDHDEQTPHEQAILLGGATLEKIWCTCTGGGCQGVSAALFVIVKSTLNVHQGI